TIEQPPGSVGRGRSRVLWDARPGRPAGQWSSVRRRVPVGGPSAGQAGWGGSWRGGGACGGLGRAGPGGAMAEPEGAPAELYGLPLDEFTAARDERAKELRADGERTAATAVRALRRPSTAAWAVNQLVRARREEVEQVLDLGAALREAQAALAGDELRALRKQQQQLVAAVVRQ